MQYGKPNARNHPQPEIDGKQPRFMALSESHIIIHHGYYIFVG